MNTQTNDTGAGTAAGAEQVSEPTGPSISEVLAFDPFAPPKGNTDAGADGAGASGSSAPSPTGAPVADKGAPVLTAEQQAAADAEAAAAAAAAAAPKPADLLAQEIARNTQAVRDVLERQGTGAQQPAAKPGATEPAAPKFNLGIPDQIMQGLSSENPQERSVAMHAVVNGVANHVWTQTETLLKSTVQEILQTIPQIIKGHSDMATRQQHVAEDFYGTYEVFKQPAFVPLMQNIGMQIAQEMSARGEAPEWNDKMRDAIAERMFLAFPMLKPVHDAAVAARAKGGNGSKPAAKPAARFTTGSGARPAIEPVNEMEAVLKAF